MPGECILKPYVVVEKVSADITERLAVKTIPCIVETKDEKGVQVVTAKPLSPDYEIISYDLMVEVVEP
jgi:hypothetical protein